MKHAYTIIADLHTHTLFSGHAHSTFLGDGGRRPGLYTLLAVADHTRRHARLSGGLVFFQPARELPLHYKGAHH